METHADFSSDLPRRNSERYGWTNSVQDDLGVGE
jgi:hypothetical protein